MNSVEINEHIAALKEFRAAYLGYLEGAPEGPRQLRQGVLRTIPNAHEALEVLGGGLIARDPPAAGGTMVYRGPRNVAFLHERPGFRLSTPPIYEAVIDSVDAAIAELEGRAERLARAEEEQPVFCRRGHKLGRSPEEAATYCCECGAPALAGCPSCESPIGVRGDDPQLPTSFCKRCGAAFPWVDRGGRIYRLENMLAAEGVDEATELAVREQLEALANPDLSEEEQEERLELREARSSWAVGARSEHHRRIVAAAVRGAIGL